jgi:hypothetical protein
MYNVQAKALVAHNSLLCQYPEDWPWVEDMIRTAIARFPAQLIKTGLNLLSKIALHDYPLACQAKGI